MSLFDPEDSEICEAFLFYIMSKPNTKEDFLEKAIKKHGDKYDYSKVEYVNSASKVIIICKEHGEFYQSPNKHYIVGRGCPSCGLRKSSDANRLSLKEFLERANNIHDTFYNYENVVYTKNHDKIKIICPMHGEFEQTASSHLQGIGCKQCGIKKARQSCRKGRDKILEKFKEKHGEYYTYNLDESILTSDNIDILCPKHGMFNQKVIVHYRSGCSKCGDEKTGEFLRNKPKELDKICRNLRRRLKNFMQKRGFKKSEKTYDVIGCTWEELKYHLENNPYGYKVDCEDLDTDHIIPISSARTEEDAYKLTHYTNLQLLPKVYNQFIKRASPFNRAHFENWLLETNYNKC